MKILTLIVPHRDHSLPLLYILITSAPILFKLIYCLWSNYIITSKKPRFFIIVLLESSTSITNQQRDAYVHLLNVRHSMRNESFLFFEFFSAKETIRIQLYC